MKRKKRKDKETTLKRGNSPISALSKQIRKRVKRSSLFSLCLGNMYSIIDTFTKNQFILQRSDFSTLGMITNYMAHMTL
jgi:hypothetical protein